MISHALKSSYRRSLRSQRCARSLGRRRWCDGFDTPCLTTEWHQVVLVRVRSCSEPESAVRRPAYNTADRHTSLRRFLPLRYHQLVIW